MSPSNESWLEVQLAGLTEAAENAWLADTLAASLGDLFLLTERVKGERDTLPPKSRAFFVDWLTDEIEKVEALLEQVGQQ